MVNYKTFLFDFFINWRSFSLKNCNNQDRKWAFESYSVQIFRLAGEGILECGNFSVLGQDITKEVVSMGG